jgi:hypothetical protein
MYLRRKDYLMFNFHRRESSGDPNLSNSISSYFFNLLFLNQRLRLHFIPQVMERNLGVDKKTKKLN